MLGFLPAWLLNNPAARWVAAIAAFLVVWKVNNEIAEHRGKMQERRRNEARTRRVQTQVRKTLNEKSTQTAIARDNVPRVSHSGELPDRTRRRFIRDN